MVSSLKNTTLFAPEIMHYHKSLINFLKQKNIFCNYYSTRNKNYQYNTSNNKKYLSILSIIQIIKSSDNFIICGNSTLKHLFIIFLVNFIFKKKYYLASDSHNIVRKFSVKYFLKYFFFKFFFNNIKGFIVPGVKSKKYLNNFHKGKKFFFFANYPFDFYKTTYFKNKKRKKLNILIVSRWVKEKNLDYTLNSLNIFCTNNPDKKIILNIVTDKSKKYIEKNVLLNKNILLNVFNTINRKKMKLMLIENDLLLLLSEFEPWGIIIEESGLFKLPSIISNNCGASELANHKFKGICNLKKKNFNKLLQDFVKDKYTYNKINNWIITPRKFSNINKNINKFISTLC